MSTKLTFLGTGAADFSPRLKDECATCFDPDARRSSSALLAGCYLIDCGVHTLQALSLAGIDPADVTDVFITHLHSDHFQPNSIRALASYERKSPLRVWVRSDAKLPDLGSAAVMRLSLYEPAVVADGVKITAVEANHDQAYYPQHLLFELDGKKILYACDGAWFINAAYNYLRSLDNPALALYVVDATCGDYAGDYRLGEHNSIPMIRQIAASLRTVGMINDETKVYLSHIAPTLHKMPHAEIEARVKDDGLFVARDGLTIAV
ncbi:MAG: MBL fold metallo-hydrolase [Ruminococcaceae bacterium]|nr:MBL fold metallo-hydrolase [Oscillospiraceae bacterium]